MGFNVYGARLDAMEIFNVQRKRQRCCFQVQSRGGLSSLLPKHEEGPGSIMIDSGLRCLLKNDFETEKNHTRVLARPCIRIPQPTKTWSSEVKSTRRSPQPTKAWSSEGKCAQDDATRPLHAAASLQSNGPIRMAQPRSPLCADVAHLCAADPELCHRARERQDLERSDGAFAQQSHHFPAAAATPVASGDGHLEELHELTSSSLRQEPPVYKKRYEVALVRGENIKDLAAQIGLTTSALEALRLTRKTASLSRIRDTSEDKELTTSIAFTPLSEEEEGEVHQALHGANRHEVLTKHERSNIDLTRSAMQCLKPGVWLNDEVINLYLELLKEREFREPNLFLKCHFFNTFFFNKLYKDACSYDFKAVRRWTTQKKLGYNLLECDKIFVPIHKDIHWCLAVINVHEKKLQYLDSLKGHDGNVLHVLARYLKDEAKDKLSQNLDASTWDLDCPKDIPEQLNGCDCGMFMIKYADFYSRGDHLKFTQEHMEYFRKRTVLELLQLKAR